MNEKKRLIKNTGLIALGNMGAKMISFILLPMYTSILSTEEYGTYDYIVALCAFLLPVVTLCMHEAMFRFIIESKDDNDRFKEVISHAFAAVFIGILVLSFVTVFVGLVFEVSYYLYFLLYLIANILYTFSVNLLRGKGEMQAYAVISSCKNILQIVLNVISVAVLRWGFAGLIISMCVSEVLAFLVTAIKSRLWRYISLNNLSVSTMREMILYALPLVPDSVCAQVINISDRMVINYGLGASANGIYSISYKFPNIIETIFHYFYTAWSESATRVFENGRDKVEDYYQSLYDVIDDIMFSFILLLTASMPVLFRIFIRGNYVEGFLYVPILMFAMYFDCLGKFYSGVFIAYKETRMLAISTAVAAAINLSVNIAFIMKGGLYAAAISTLVAEFVMVEIRRHFIKRYIHINISVKKVLTEIFATVVVCLFYNYNNWIIIACSILIALIYTFAINKKILILMKNALFSKLKSKER